MKGYQLSYFLVTERGVRNSSIYGWIDPLGCLVTFDDSFKAKPPQPHPIVGQISFATESWGEVEHYNFL
jgi:hypothetical protein